MYADDIMLVSHSLYVMQLMLDICSQEAADLDFTFSTNKSVALRVGAKRTIVLRWFCLALSFSIFSG